MNFRLVHAATHTTRITIDASDDSLPERFIVSSLVECLHDDGFASCVATAQDDHNLSRLQDFSHLWLCSLDLVMHLKLERRLLVRF